MAREHPAALPAISGATEFGGATELGGASDSTPPLNRLGNRTRQDGDSKPGSALLPRSAGPALETAGGLFRPPPLACQVGPQRPRPQLSSLGGGCACSGPATLHPCCLWAHTGPCPSLTLSPYPQAQLSAAPPPSSYFVEEPVG